MMTNYINWNEAISTINSTIDNGGKVTERAYLNALLVNDSVKAVNGMEAFIKRKIAQLDNKRAGSDKARARKAEEREELASKVVDVFGADNNPMTATEIAGLIGVSVQRAVPILKSMVKDGTLEMTTLKGGKNIYELGKDVTCGWEAD